MSPPPPSLRKLALADLTTEDLRWMIDEGETLVELKREIPTDGLGPSVAAFANSLGGWLILGVEDRARKVVGWTPKGRADVPDYLRDLLRQEVDPLPPFAAKEMAMEEKPVGVVRIYESNDTPHIVRRTGGVYVRDPGGKRPIQEHSALIELARRGEEAEGRARERLRSTPTVGRVLLSPDAGYPTDERDVRVIARAAPLTVTPAVRDWPLTRKASDWCLQFADALLPASSIPFGRHGPTLDPFGRAIAAKVVQEKGAEASDRCVVVADSNGVVGIELRRGTLRGDRPTVVLESLLDTELRPLATALAALLYESEAHGRAAVDLFLVMPPKGSVSGERRRVGAGDLHVSRELVIPADEEDVDELANAWHRELQRCVGIVKFEGEPADT